LKFALNIHNFIVFLLFIELSTWTFIMLENYIYITIKKDILFLLNINEQIILKNPRIRLIYNYS